MKVNHWCPRYVIYNWKNKWENVDLLSVYDTIEERVVRSGKVSELNIVQSKPHDASNIILHS